MMKQLLRIISLVLVLTMLVQILPVGALGQELRELTANVDRAASLPIKHAPEELEALRTEYTKQFKLPGGLQMATVYNEPVHYETANGWAQIDNRLTLGKDGKYRNTAGVWQVALPTQLSGGQPISITKDSYTLSFSMAGVLTNQGHEVMNIPVEETIPLTELESAEVALESSSATEAMQLQTITGTVAQYQPQDTTAAKAEAQYPETVVDNLSSRLLYSNVYANTHVAYDVVSNKVKESVILEQYDSTLRGYRYTLNTGSLVPVLHEDGRIDLRTPDGKTVVMVMQAPFLVDREINHCYDVDVNLTGSNGSYTLTYLLPRQWLASEDRS